MPASGVEQRIARPIDGVARHRSFRQSGSRLLGWSIDERACCDNYYLESWSLCLDVMP